MIGGRGGGTTGAQHAPGPGDMEISLVPLENGGAMTVRGGGEARAGCGQATGGGAPVPLDGWAQRWRQRTRAQEVRHAEGRGAGRVACATAAPGAAAAAA